MVNAETVNGKKVKILGAGISGLVTGIVLSKHNYEVEIFEKRSHVGSFFEKDIHSFRNYLYKYDVIEKYKKLGIKIPDVYPIYKEFRFSPSMKKVEIYSKGKPLFYNFIRGYKEKESLDVNLFETAKRSGVKFYFNKEVEDNKVDIVASGACSVKMMGYGGHYSRVSNMIPYTNYVFLNNKYSPHGYSYILPFKDEVSIVLGSTKKESKNALRKRFNRLKKDNPVVKKIINNSKFENEIFGHLSYDLSKTAIRNKKIYVGESAGFLDAATMFGTHYAILSGYLAAMAIIKNRNYDILWKKAFKDELKSQYLKREKLEKFINQDYNQTIESLIKNYGNKILSSDYRKLHK